MLPIHHALLAVPFALDPAKAIDAQRHGGAEIGLVSPAARPAEP